MRLAPKPYIEHHFVTCKPFAQRKPRAHKTSGSQWRCYRNSLDSLVAGYIQGSCIVVRLRDYRQRVASEDLFRPDNRIESSEARIIKYDFVFRHSSADQRIAHSCRFIIESCMIISARNYIFHFSGVIQLCGSLYSVYEITVEAAATISRIRSEQQSHAISRYRHHAVEYKALSSVFNSNVDIDRENHYGDCNRCNTKKQMPDSLFHLFLLACNLVHKIKQIDWLHYLARLRSVPAGVWKTDSPKRPMVA